MSKKMDPADPNTHLRNSGIPVTRSKGPAPKQINKAAPRPSRGPKSGPGGSAGRIR